VHRDESLLRHRTGLAGFVTEAKLPYQCCAAKVESLPVGQHGDLVDIEPAAAVDAEGEGKPVGQVHQALVVDGRTRHFVDKAVVYTGRVGARIVHLTGL